jgi:hypothetical protein
MSGVSRNVPTSIFFMFLMSLTICKLYVLVCILPSLTTFGVDQLVFYVASWMYAMEGSANCQDKKGAFGDGKLNFEIIT